MIEWFDSAVLDWFLSVRTPVLTAFAKFYTTLGEGGMVWIALGLILLVFRKTRKIGVTVLLALLFSLIVCNITLKNIVARPRPCWRNPLVEMLVSVPKDYSFPSGHSMASFAAASAVFAWEKRWGVAAVAAAAVMGATRLYLYVHYPTDVLTGIVLGSLLGAAAYLIVKRLRNKWSWLY